MSIVADHIVVGTTPVQLPDIVCRRLHLTAKQPGGPVIWIGDSDITAGFNGNGWPIGYGDFVLEEVSNLNEVYAVAESETSLRYLAER